ncbi:MAG: TetR/AcrR family transcriptional regulator [Desulfobacter sp.]|nr:MAG: TetR/AcrR family transcriptional regulator [Desulfobacter sp.]
MGRKSKADQRRTQIIQAFYQCVVDAGLAGASIRKIAEAAGVQPSTLHHYFTGRDEIIEEAVAYYTDGIFEGFRTQMKGEAGEGGAENKDGPTLDQAISFIFSKGMINEEHTGFFLECLVAARGNPRIRATIARLFERFRNAVIEHLVQVPGFEDLAPARQELLASTIVAVHEGIELQWFADPGRVDLARTLETTKDIISFFIRESNPGQSASKGG